MEKEKREREVNYFGELMSVLTDEELIRIGYRLKKVGKLETAGVLGEELAGREGKGDGI